MTVRVRMDPGSLDSFQPFPTKIRFFFDRDVLFVIRWLPGPRRLHFILSASSGMPVFTLGCLYQRMVDWVRSQTGKTERVLQRSSSNSISYKARLPSPKERPDGCGRDQGPPREWEKRAQSLSSSSLQVPVSMCSKSCQPGQMKKPVGLHPCCFECLDCPPGTYLNRSVGMPPTTLLCPSLAELRSSVQGSVSPPCPGVFRGPFTLPGSLGVFSGDTSIQRLETRPGASCGFP